MRPTRDLGCVPNSLMRGMLVELGIVAFNALTHEWFNPELAVEQKFRWAGFYRSAEGASNRKAEGPPRDACHITNPRRTVDSGIATPSALQLELEVCS